MFLTPRLSHVSFSLHFILLAQLCAGLTDNIPVEHIELYGYNLQNPKKGQRLYFWDINFFVRYPTSFVMCMI